MVLRLIITILFLANAKAVVNDVKNGSAIDSAPDNVFNGVYSECFLHLSYSCLQMKTLLYLKELNNLSEVSVIGDYVKFVKINKSNTGEDEQESKSGDTEELAFMIDKAIDNFFDNHVLKFYALGRNISMPRNVEEFVGRKKRKGGGGGGMGGHGGGGGHDDGGKKKMMMMAMMCMKMKLMMMVPAMMGMMGMMSFKGMMFSMMSFMLSKMMLLMKILEKKGGSGLGAGGGGGGLDGGWPAAGGGGGAWMPAGGQDYAGGGGGGGYDANGQWQSRSMVITPGAYKTIEDPPTNKKPIDDERKYNDNTLENYAGDKWDKRTIDNRLHNTFKPGHNQWLTGSVKENLDAINKPEISFISSAVKYNNNIEKETHKKPVLVYKRSNVNFDFNNPENAIGKDNESVDDNYKLNLRLKRDLRLIPSRKTELYSRNDDKTYQSKNRQKRSIIDLLQNSYIYWVNRILGLNNNRRTNPQRYKVVNGVKYVYYPYKLQKPKMLKEMQMTESQNNDLKTMVAVEDFNKGEIVEGAIQSRMSNNKFNKIKDTVNDTMDNDPWE